MNNEPTSRIETPKLLISVCGKGGVGKTVFSALLSKVMMEAGIKPLLLVDADPVGGLTSAIGENIVGTLAAVKEQFIREVMAQGRDGAAEAAENLNYFILRALVEHDSYSLLAMGHTTKKGCFCSANTLLRQALAAVIDPFSGVIIDAEAGIEQINREVTRDVNKVFVVVDASKRSIDTLHAIAGMVDPAMVSVIINRASPSELSSLISGDGKLLLPGNLHFAGTIPEDETLKRYDRQGISIWQLPFDNPALQAVRNILRGQLDHLTKNL